MRSVMAACFWVCVVCALAGATVGVLRVWGQVTDYEVSEVWQTILIVFAASAVTLVVGRVTLGRGLNAAANAERS